MIKRSNLNVSFICCIISISYFLCYYIPYPGPGQEAARQFPLLAFFLYFSMDEVIFLISSLGIAILPNGRIARAMSFIGLSSAATRLELIFRI